MNCPRCASPLRELERGGLALDRCEGCGGVWLDRGELKQVLEQLLALDHDENEHHWKPSRHRRSIGAHPTQPPEVRRSRTNDLLDGWID